MQVVSFINMKGGVAKTTLAVNVAYALAAVHRKNVLLVDSDPQFNATQYLLEDDEYLAHAQDQRKGTIKDIFVPRQPQVRMVTGPAKATKSKLSLNACAISVYNAHGRGKLDLIPSTIALMELETSRRGTEGKLRSYLKEKATGYDYVLIDCPPTISFFTQAAILASDRYLVPIKPDPLSVIGLPLLERWLEEFTDDSGTQVESVGLVFTMIRGPIPTSMKDVMRELRERRGEAVFDSYLSQSTDVAKSVIAHRPVFRYRPNSKTANQILDIASEFLERTSGENE